MVDLKEQISVYLDHLVEHVDPDTVGESLAERSVQAPQRSNRSGMWIAVAAAVAVLVLIGAIPLIISPADGPPADDLVSTTVQSAPVDPEISEGRLLKYPLVAYDGAYWMVGRYGDSEGLTRIDPATLEVTDAIRAGESPVHIIPTEDGLWVLDGDSGDLFLVDTSILQVTDSIASRGWLEPILIGETLWVHTHTQNPAVVGVDLTARAVISETPVGSNSPWWADSINGVIWSYAPGDGLRRFDTNTLEVDVFAVTVGYTEECCLAADDAIWMTNHEGLVIRFDVATHEVTDQLGLERPLGVGVVGAGGLWLPSTHYGGDDPLFAVIRIDLETREVTDVIPVGSRPYGPVFVDGAIWVAHNDGTVSGIDVETRQVSHTTQLPAQPHDLYVVEGTVWVAYPDDGVIARVDP